MIENINSPADLKKLDKKELDVLVHEIRQTIIHGVAENGGHLASNLGIVEATVVLHRLFDAPDDKIIFDVGHQCYTHKLLTGRYKDFGTLRKKDGISGFTRRGESLYDTLTAGHSGSALSAALGIASANKLSGKDSYTVCVIGDGSFTNGMVYEALNNCNNDDMRLIILLNDNEMSISSNVGGLASYLSRIRTSTRYYRVKHKFQDILRKIPVAGENLISGTRKLKNFLKRMFLPKNTFFDVLGVRYFGPVDGNDMERLENVLAEAKRCGKCCIVHMKTVKGMGYKPAEENPTRYHSVGKFDVNTGTQSSCKTSFTSVFGEYLTNTAKNNDKICAITSAMCDGTGLSDFACEYPDRFFDVGIAEEHEIAFAGGLAEEGYLPVCAVYSTFSQRVYDQVFHDVALQDLHAVIALDHAGFVPDDGITHQGLSDAALFSSIPGCTIYNPETYKELEECLDKSLNANGVCIVRYPKGAQTEYDRTGFETRNGGDFTVCGKSDSKVVLITYGRSTYNAVKAAEKLSKDGISVKIIKLVKLCPLDSEKIFEEIGNPRILYFLEEGIKNGGIAEQLFSSFAGKLDCKTYINAVDNAFAPHANTQQLYKIFGMDPGSVSAQIKQLIESSK